MRVLWFFFWCFIGFYGGFMGFYVIFWGFYGVLWGLCDLFGFYKFVLVFVLWGFMGLIMVLQWI